MKRLTPKQEKFAREYFRTGNASEAYRLAYDCENMQADTIRVRASELLANSDITVMVNRLRERAEKRTILSKERALEILAAIAEGDDVKDADRVAALKQAGKFQGWEAPIRQHITAAVMSPYEKFIEAMKEPEGAPEDEDK